jgi:hypothetical protein
MIQEQLKNLPDKYGLQFQNWKAGTQGAISGFTGWELGQDDPNTPQDESLELKFNPNSGPGTREITGIKMQKSKSNQDNMLHSSFANKDMSAAIASMREDQRNIVLGRAQAMQDVWGNWQGEINDLSSRHATLLGSDTQWMIENPLPPVKPKITGGGKAMNYKEWLKARYPNNPKSTKARAAAFKRHQAAGFPKPKKKEEEPHWLAGAGEAYLEGRSGHWLAGAGQAYLEGLDG